MKISEIAPTKAKTPAELRVDALKRQADQATSNLKAEQQRQRIKRAQSRIAKLKTAATR